MHGPKTTPLKTFTLQRTNRSASKEKMEIGFKVLITQKTTRVVAHTFPVKRFLKVEFIVTKLPQNEFNFMGALKLP